MPQRLRPFLLLSMVIGLLGIAPSPASATVRVARGETENGTNQGVRPFTIPCCDWYWSELSWTTWTDDIADGSGSYFAYCIGEPGCPKDDSGFFGYFEYPVLIHLYGIQDCSGEQTFTRIQTTFTAEPPYWGDESVITDRLYCPRPPPAGGAGGGAAPPPPPCIAFISDRCKVEPKRLIAGARAILESLKWKRWGDRRAVGHGRFHLYPGAIDPTEIVEPAVVKLHGLRGCGDGRARYTKVSVRYGGDGYQARAQGCN